MNKYPLFLSVMAAICLLIGACSEPSLVGNELIEDELSNFNFTDTVSIQATTRTQDSVLTYTPIISLQPTSYLCGQINDPIFGTSRSDLYFTIRLNALATSSIFDLNFDGATLDSLVLILAFDSTSYYGDTLAPQNISVYRVTEEIENSVPHYSNENFATEATPIGSLDFSAKIKTPYLDSPTDTTPSIGRLRIRLDDALGNELLAYDSLTYANSENFNEQFKGLKLVAGSNNTALLKYNLASLTTRMNLYYTRDTQEIYSYEILDLSTKTTHYSHDYTGSIIEPFIDNTMLGDSLIFVQGMSGTNVQISFPHLQALTENTIVNKARLEFTVAYLDVDDTLEFDQVRQLDLAYRNADGFFVSIEDVSTAVEFGNLSAVFGGNREQVDDNGMVIDKYSLEISNHFQDIISNLAENGNLYLRVFSKGSQPSRIVLFGPGHSTYPMKLNLTYTDL